MKSRPRILLVDDHEVVRVSLKTLIERQPHMEVVGESGRPKTQCSKERQVPDVVVLDLQLPNSRDIEACREIKARLPSIEVIALTSFPRLQWKM